MKNKTLKTKSTEKNNFTKHIFSNVRIYQQKSEKNCIWLKIFRIWLDFQKKISAIF